MDEILTWASIRGVLRRRWRVFFLVAVPIFLAAVAVALLLPPKYRSSARILIEEQQIPKEYVQTTVTSYVEARLQAISQQIMSRATLLEIINRFNLYADVRQKSAVEDAIDQMRKDVELKTVSADVADKRNLSKETTIGFTISYIGADASVVQKVTDTLASLYLNENLKSREQHAANTTAFLQQEIDHLRGQTSSLNSQISEFKRAHLTELPEVNTVNIQTRDRLAQESERLAGEIRMLQERRVLLQGQLAMVDPVSPAPAGRETGDPRARLQELRFRLTALRGRVSDQHPDVKAMQREIRELENQVGAGADFSERAGDLAAMKEELGRKKRVLGPNHPDILALSRSVESLEKSLERAQKSGVGQSGLPSLANPAYVNLQTQLASTDLEIKGLIEQRGRVEAKVQDYERRIGEAPLVEQEYSRLTRDLQTAQRRYDETMNKLMEAKVAQGMEESQRGERFTIVDPAEFPEKPYKPNRIAIALIGFVLAVGAGVGGAAAMESLDPSIKTIHDIEALTEFPILCELPFIEDEPRIGPAKAAFLVLVSLAAVGAVALVAVHFFVQPLDVFWFRLMRRLG